MTVMGSYNHQLMLVRFVFSGLKQSVPFDYRRIAASSQLDLGYHGALCPMTIILISQHPEILGILSSVFVAKHHKEKLIGKQIAQDISVY